MNSNSFFTGDRAAGMGLAVKALINFSVRIDKNRSRTALRADLGGTTLIAAIVELSVLVF